MRSLLFFLLFICQLVYGHGFIAGTLVATPDGYVPIEQLHAGDQIIASDPQGSYHIRPVIALYCAHTDCYIQLTVDKEVIGVAPDNLFYVANKSRWIHALMLASRHTLVVSNGNNQVVTILLVLKPTDLYTLTIDGLHTFCITRNNIVVHNVALQIGGELISLIDVVVRGLAPGVTIISGTVYQNTGEAIECIWAHEGIISHSPSTPAATPPVYPADNTTAHVSGGITAAATTQGTTLLTKAACIGVGAVGIATALAGTAYVIGSCLPNQDEQPFVSAQEAEDLANWFSCGWRTVKSTTTRNCSNFKKWVDSKFTSGSPSSNTTCGSADAMPPEWPDGDEDDVYKVSEDKASRKHLPGPTFVRPIYEHKTSTKRIGSVLQDRFGNEIHLIDRKHGIQQRGNISPAAQHDIAAKAYARSIQVTGNVRIAPHPTNNNMIIGYFLEGRQGKRLTMHNFEVSVTKINQQYCETLRAMKLLSPKGFNLLLNNWPW